jgi:hypothetical protein
MADPQPAQAGIGPLREVLADLRNTAREQMVAAWQIHVEHIQEQLAAGWPERIAWIFEERFRELQASLEEQYRATINENVAAALLDARGAVREDFADKLNQSMRRLRMFESDAQWASAVLDATESYCDRAALFTLSGLNLHLEAVRGMQKPAELADVPLADAPAFASVVATSDAMVALRTRGVFSDTLAGVFGEEPGLRFHLFPIATRERVLAILYADSAGAMEANAVELIASIAGTVLDSISGRSSAPAQLVRIATGERTGAGIGAWFELSREDQELHLKAQRFARVQVAEMRLYKSDAVKDGRARRDLYDALKAEIDNAREVFQRDYLTATPTMVDYFHLELNRTLANGDAELLGRSYPGPLA